MDVGLCVEPGPSPPRVCVEVAPLSLMSGPGHHSATRVCFRGESADSTRQASNDPRVALPSPGPSRTAISAAWSEREPLSGGAFMLTGSSSG
jgi:hypothetical protein